MGLAPSFSDFSSSAQQVETIYLVKGINGFMMAALSQGVTGYRRMHMDLLSQAILSSSLRFTFDDKALGMTPSLDLQST